jgi:hypothetical protein
MSENRKMRPEAMKATTAPFVYFRFRAGSPIRVSRKDPVRKHTAENQIRVIRALLSESVPAMSSERSPVNETRLTSVPGTWLYRNNAHWIATPIPFPKSVIFKGIRKHRYGRRRSGFREFAI